MSDVWIPVSRPSINVRDSFRVFRAVHEKEVSGHSKYVLKFEQALSKYLDNVEVVATSSGTSALDLIPDLLNLDEKSAIVCGTFNIISTVSEVARRGCKLVFIDSDAESWSIDANLAMQYLKLNSNVEAVYGTHIYNSYFDIELISEFCNQQEIPLIEDAAEGLGGVLKGQKLGTLGDISVLSFYANKLFTTGEGGALTFNDEFLATRARSLSNLGFSRERRFWHHVLGRNVRMNGLGASLGLSQIRHAEENRLKRKSLYKRYLENLMDVDGLIFQGKVENSADFESAYWVMPILLQENGEFNAEKLQGELLLHGIETRRFFCPMHLQPVFQDYKFEVVGTMKVSEGLWELGLYLPLSGAHKNWEVDYVCQVLIKLLGK